jgi:hypothetical protein
MIQPALVRHDGFLLLTVVISIMSNLPDLDKVRSGPGVSVVSSPAGRWSGRFDRKCNFIGN